jgi:hypothetical protein
MAIDAKVCADTFCFFCGTHSDLLMCQLADCRMGLQLLLALIACAVRSYGLSFSGQSRSGQRHAAVRLFERLLAIASRMSFDTGVHAVQHRGS